MEDWRFIDLGRPEPYAAQTFYEAVAEEVGRGASPNTLLMLNPGAPYVCVGYHQDMEKEIDLEHCRASGFPVIRRTQGGGATYLDGNQVFYQIAAKDSGAVPRGVDEMFRRLLAVTVETYRRLGVPAEYKPINDVVVEGRKISGNGASRNGEAGILVGNIIQDMDYDAMARVLKVSDEKFRDKMAKSMRDWVSNLTRELGESPSADRIKSVYAEEFQRLLGVRLTTGAPTREEQRIFKEEILPRNLSHEWLFMEAPYSTRKPGRSVKIAHDVKVVEADYKAGKLIRVRAELQGDRILDARITGDFFATPRKAIFRLEERIRGAPLTEASLMSVVEGLQRETHFDIQGVSVDDLVQALLKLRTLI